MTATRRGPDVVIPLILDAPQFAALRRIVERDAVTSATNGRAPTSVERQLRDQINALTAALATSVQPGSDLPGRTIDTAEAGRRLGISRHAVADLCRRNRIPHTRDGRRFLLDPADVAAYIPRSAR